MELTELQNIWSRQDEMIKENIRLNRDILRHIVQVKPERRIKWIKIQSIFNLILPLVLLATVLIPNLKFRNEISFYTGAFLFGSFFIITYLWALKYFLLIIKIDFSESIVNLKREVAELEKYKLRITKLGYLLAPFGITGIFMLTGLRIQKFTFYNALPLFLIVIVFVSSVYITFKYSIFERFRKLNKEISELEILGRD